MIASVAALATSLAGMAAVTCVADTNVVVRAAPLTRTADVDTKLLPVAVSVNAADPTATTLPHSVSVGTFDPSGNAIPVQYPTGFPTTVNYNPYLKVYYIYLSPAPYKTDGTVYTLQIDSDLLSQPVNVKFVVKNF